MNLDQHPKGWALSGESVVCGRFPFWGDFIRRIAQECVDYVYLPESVSAEQTQSVLDWFDKYRPGFLTQDKLVRTAAKLNELGTLGLYSFGGALPDNNFSGKLIASLSWGDKDFIADQLNCYQERGVSSVLSECLPEELPVGLDESLLDYFYEAAFWLPPYVLEVRALESSKASKEIMLICSEAALAKGFAVLEPVLGEALGVTQLNISELNFDEGFEELDSYFRKHKKCVLALENPQHAFAMHCRAEQLGCLVYSFGSVLLSPVRFALFQHTLPYNRLLDDSIMDRVRLLCQELKHVAQREDQLVERFTPSSNECIESFEAAFLSKRIGMSVNIDPYYEAWSSFIFENGFDAFFVSFWEKGGNHSFLLGGTGVPFLGRVNEEDRSGLINKFLKFYKNLSGEFQPKLKGFKEDLLLSALGYYLISLNRVEHPESFFEQTHCYYDLVEILLESLSAESIQAYVLEIYRTSNAQGIFSLLARHKARQGAEDEALALCKLDRELSKSAIWDVNYTAYLFGKGQCFEEGVAFCQELYEKESSTQGMLTSLAIGGFEALGPERALFESKEKFKTPLEKLQGLLKEDIRLEKYRSWTIRLLGHINFLLGDLDALEALIKEHFVCKSVQKKERIVTAYGLWKLGKDTRIDALIELLLQDISLSDLREPLIVLAYAFLRAMGHSWKEARAGFKVFVERWPHFLSRETSVNASLDHWLMLALVFYKIGDKNKYESFLNISKELEPRIPMKEAYSLLVRPIEDESLGDLVPVFEVIN